MMRSIVLLCLGLLLLLPSLSSAEYSFDFNAPETFVTVGVGDFTSFDNMLTNTGDQDDIFIVTLTGEEMPDDWTTYMCIAGQCLAPFVRTYPDTLSAGEDDSITVDYVAASEGIGSLWLRIQSTGDPSVIDSVQFTVQAVTDAVAEDDSRLPESFSLGTVYPNPFNSRTVVSFTLPREAHTTLSVWSIEGRRVETILDESLSTGAHRAVFAAPEGLAGGLYLIRLDSAGRTAVTRALLVR